MQILFLERNREWRDVLELVFHHERKLYIDDQAAAQGKWDTLTPEQVQQLRNKSLIVQAWSALAQIAAMDPGQPLLADFIASPEMEAVMQMAMPAGGM